MGRDEGIQEGVYANGSVAEVLMMIVIWDWDLMTKSLSRKIWGLVALL